MIFLDKTLFKETLVGLLRTIFLDYSLTHVCKKTVERLIQFAHIIAFNFTTHLFSFSGIFFYPLLSILQTHSYTVSKAQLKCYILFEDFFYTPTVASFSMLCLTMFSKFSNYIMIRCLYVRLR